MLGSHVLLLLPMRMVRMMYFKLTVAADDNDRGSGAVPTAAAAAAAASGAGRQGGSCQEGGRSAGIIG
jgi:hypothetical protein